MKIDQIQRIVLLFVGWMDGGLLMMAEKEGRKKRIERDEWRFGIFILL